MESTHDTTPTHHDPTLQRAPYVESSAPTNTTPLSSEGRSAGRLLGDPRLNARGNGVVRTALMLQTQRTAGNRALQRALHPAAVSHHAGLAAVQRAVDITVRPPTRPDIHHDHGFLDDGHGNIDETRRQSPTISDYASRELWIAKLNGAELLRADLVDATAAYRHFLFGNGAARPIDYQRYIANDSSGATLLASVSRDVLNAARQEHDRRLGQPAAGPTAPASFDLASGAIGVGSEAGYPYPATENWQKAIGAHIIWIAAHVDVTVDTAAQTRTFTISVTIHMEDRYNFNPGMQDVATGTPDAANGRFEITGLGHEYMNTGTLTQTLHANEALTSGPGAGPPTNDPGERTPRPPRDGRGTGRR